MRPLRFPVCLPGLLKKHAAEFEERIHLCHVPPHTRTFDAPRREVLACTLNGARADEVALLPIAPIAHTVLILLKVVQNGRESWAQIEKGLEMSNNLLDFVVEQ